MAYRDLVRTDPEPTTLDELRKAANFSVPLGNERFAEPIERARDESRSGYYAWKAG